MICFYFLSTARLTPISIFCIFTKGFGAIEVLLYLEIELKVVLALCGYITSWYRIHVCNN